VRERRGAWRLADGWQGGLSPESPPESFKSSRIGPENQPERVLTARGGNVSCIGKAKRLILHAGTKDKGGGWRNAGLSPVSFVVYFGWCTTLLSRGEDKETRGGKKGEVSWGRLVYDTAEIST